MFQEVSVQYLPRVQEVLPASLKKIQESNVSDGKEIFSKVPDIGYQESRPATDPAEFAKVLQARRSVRVYDKTPVPEKVMREVLEWSLLAPNSSNLQCWQFYWVRNPKIKADLVKACFSQPAAATAQELVVAGAKPRMWKENAKQMLKVFAEQEAAGTRVPKSALAYYKKLAPFVYTQGPFSILGHLKKVLYFFRGLTQVTPREPTSHAEMKLWAVKSSALGCENFMLGMSAQGFDTCPMEGFDSKRAKKALGLGCGDHITMIISAGRRASNGIYGPRVRFPSSQFIHEVL